MKFDVTILTEPRYLNPEPNTSYLRNVLLEDQLVKEALERKGLKVERKSWDDQNFNWEESQFCLFRTTWDYFERFDEFKPWLDSTSLKTHFLNSKEIVYWNMDKHYLGDLEKKGVNIAPTQFIEPGDLRSLLTHIDSLPWDEFILKPAIAGTARHTYRFKRDDAGKRAKIFEKLIAKESMLLQEYQKQITTKGEISLVMFGGKFSHAVLKKAKAGDFRVQDDFGGTVHDYKPNSNEIAFAERALEACRPHQPIYARIDIFWDNNDKLCLAELELIEPELWFRKNEKAADLLASEIVNSMP
jgi:glutathione synthase/RimK-type ligase-like ATP-grasp enzyme